MSATTSSGHLPHTATTTTTTTIVESVDNPNVQLRLSLRRDSLDRVPSCQHTFSQVEVMNLHASDPVIIQSIQTTPEETFLIRYDPQIKEQRQPKDDSSANLDDNIHHHQQQEEEPQDVFSASRSSTSSWDQRSIPQQIHTAQVPTSSTTSSTSSGTGTSSGFRLLPGQTATIPITYLPRYPCTSSFGGSDNNNILNNELLEDYYAQQQAPYQIAFSSTFDPDDDNFSLAQPPPPKITKYVSGTARADWEQLLKDMPPQERSNWLQQQQQQQQQYHLDGSSIKQPPHSTPTTDNIGGGSDASIINNLNHDPIINDNDVDGDGEEWIFEVRTTVLVETSRGSIQLPVRASSRRQNAYGLPDVIYFDQDDNKRRGGSSSQKSGSSSSRASSSSSASPQPSDQKRQDNDDNNNNNGKKTRGVLWLDTDLALAESRKDSGDNDPEESEDYEDETSPNTSRDCYNLFMTNPRMTQDLRIAEVYVSRPDRMNLQVQGQLRAPSNSIRQWWNAPSNRPGRNNNDTDTDTDNPEESTTSSSSSSSGTTQELGSLVLGPGEQRYVVTVCTAGSSSATTSDSSEWLHGNDSDDDGSAEEIALISDASQSTLEARAAKAAARAARLAASAKYSLGFLNIKTEAGDTLFVALERLRKECRSGSQSNAAGGKTSGLSPQSSPTSASDQRRQQAYPPTYHHALYQVQDQPLEELAARAGKPASVTAAPAIPLVTSVLKPEPPRLDFSLLSSSSPTVISYLGIHNPKDYPIKIMRSGVAVEIEDELDPNQPNPEELGLHMSVKIQNSYLEADALTKEALRVTCSIRWDRFQSHNLESLFFHGNVILRATAHVDFNYHQWIKNLVNTNSKKAQGKILIPNDYADEPSKPDSTQQTEFVLEIPLTVSMVQGKIGIMIHRTSHPFPHLWAVQSWKEGLGSVSSIFYPQRAFDIRAELDSGDGPLTEPIFGPSGIDHKLRIFANINIPSRVGSREEFQPPSLQLATAKIVEDESNSTSSDDTLHDDTCSRFNVTIGAPPEGAFPFEGFNDAGLVHIKYRFPKSGDGDTDGDQENGLEYSSIPAYPKYCYLTLTTDPYTELHQIPLVVYPGQTDITATQLPSKAEAKHRKNKYKKKNQKKKTHEGRTSKGLLEPEEISETPSHAVVGFEGLLHWFKVSSVGKSLKSLLEQTEIEQRDWGWNRRGFHNDDKLLANYVASLCRKSVNLKTAQLRPVLLKVGAIKHGTVETASFYMTNHNPIPLLVSVDVGEVEGMSISLARVPTRGQGDGHNILDHFPKKRSVVSSALGGPYQHLVPNGEYQGHPLEGLRKFLRTTDVAQQFLSIFRYRDAISLSPTAVERQPLLNTLYKKYAFGEFHRDPLPIRFGQDGWSKCRRRIHPSRSPSRSFIEPDYEHNVTDCCDDEEEEDDFVDEESTKVISGKGPLLISDDSRILRPLKICWDKDAEPFEYPSDGTYTIVPPGAVARFELKLHAPPRSKLKDDITRFLSTGLVLSTDHNEILPIFVTFEALLGELQVSESSNVSQSSSVSTGSDCHMTSQDSKKNPNSLLGNASSIEVPANWFHESQSGPLDIIEGQDNDVEIGQLPRTKISDHDDKAVRLRVSSSFSRDIRLVSVTSCNPWFEVKLEEKDGSRPLLPSYRGAGSRQGVDIGTIRSTINCQARRNPIAILDYPSFYQCALNWMTHRAELQPRGCGVSPAVRPRTSSSDDSSNLIQVAEHGGVKRAVKALEKALLVSSFAFGNDHSALVTGESYAVAETDEAERARRSRSPGDGLLAPIVLDVFANAWHAWRIVADYGLSKLSSTLQATIEYDSAASSSREISKLQNLSVAMRETIMATSLSTPKLFDCRRAREKNTIANAITGDDDSPSILEFNPTMVADSSSVTIPLRNPTSVPVKVRLATAVRIRGGVADSTTSSGTSERDPLKARFGADDEVRDSFTESSASPFVQSGKLNISTQHYHAGVIAEQLWWDGSGGYFLADDYGDLIRSHHNIRIMAGAGAHVSLVNPSLHSNVAILVGCGVRCGIRDEKNSPLTHDNNETSKLTSPIGASAAAGVTLAGRIRSNLPQVNVRVSEEPLYAAGADTPGKHSGPAAFAVPYSALDGVVIPPFGEVELGPILFRPPGRYSVHGCQTASDSRMISRNDERSKACSSNFYQSMVYLENSLTGLERISLKGKAMWEKLVFLDPPPSDPLFGDDFGDIELRHGRSALMFSGSRAHEEIFFRRLPSLTSAFPGSVIKEVMVYNAGDTMIDIESVYFSDAARLHKKYSTSVARDKDYDRCSYKQFRLLNCLEEENDVDERGLQNIENGFQLEPGQNISLFIEHFPDCSRPREFIALNLERRRRGRSSSTNGKVELLSPSGAETKHQFTKNAFRRRKFDLLVGYEMTDNEFRSCQTVKRWGYSMRNLHIEAQCAANKNCRKSWFSKLNHRLFLFGCMVLGFLLMLGLLASAYSIIFKGYLYRQYSSDFFASALVSRRKTADSGSSDKPPAQPVVGRGNWSAAFRCLARADPSSSDLQTLGREQIRHVVLGRYNSMGILPPQCFNSSGVFCRERGAVAVSGSPTRQIPGKESTNGGNDRVRTLSDGIFRHFATHQDAHLRNSVPCGLSWRVAVTRGIALPRLSENTPSFLKVPELQLQRAAQEKKKAETPDQSPESSERRQSDDASEESVRTDEVSEAQYTDDDGEESQLQESFVSELSEEQIPETPDDGSEETAAAELNTEENLGASTDELDAEEQVDNKSGTERSQSTAIAVRPTPETSVPPEKSVEEKKVGDYTNGASKSAEMPNSKSPDSETLVPETGNIEREPAARPQKKKDKSQEPKWDRRSRQRMAPPAAKTDSLDGNTAGGTPSQQEKSSHTKEPRNKTNDIKIPSRPGKGRAEKGKQQSSGKTNQNREKKSGTSTAESKSRQAGEQDGNKRKTNKLDTAGIAKNNSKDSKDKSSANETKSKSSASKKAKRGRSGKGALTQPKSRDQDPQPEPEVKEVIPEPILRPPPGLAPPPGFGQDSAAAQPAPLPRPTFETQLLTPAAVFLSDTSILGSPSSTVIGTPARSIADSAFGGLSPSILNASGEPPSLADTPLRGVLPPSARDAGEALLASVTSTPMNRGMDISLQSNNSTAGFDVMDFLDSILNDGNSAPHAGSPQSPFISGNPTPLPPLSSDPWATERQSRASAYGIAIDELPTTDGLSTPTRIDALDDEGEHVTPVPLLNTAAILYTTNRNRDDDDDDEDEENDDSFYASLLGKNVEDDDNSRRY